MPASELRIANRTAYFRKAIRTPDFSSERVLAGDAFQFAELWLKRECPDALPFWHQAQSYYRASMDLPPRSSPLTSYFCFLNAAKSLLLVKGVKFSDYHGVSGRHDPYSKRALRNELIHFQAGGILRELSRLLEEEEKTDEPTPMPGSSPMRMGNTLFSTAGTPARLMNRTYKFIRISITTTAGFRMRFV
jgi:hypothetical protein